MQRLMCPLRDPMVSKHKGPSFPELWRKVMDHDHYRCRYCNLDMSKSPEWRFLTVDHIIPQGQRHLCGKFGLDSIHDERNLVTACRYCNNVNNRWLVPENATTIFEVFRLKADIIKEKCKGLDVWWKEQMLKSCAK